MGMAIDRLQSGDARELDGPCSAAFVSSSAAVRTAWHFVVRLGDGLAEMGDGSRSIDSFPPSASAIGSAKRGTRTRRNLATEPGFKPSCDVSFGRSRELTRLRGLAGF